MPIKLIIGRPITPPPSPDRESFLKKGVEAKNPYLICYKLDRGNGPTPWLTVILGSGCTDSRSQAKALFEVAAGLKTVTGSAVPKPIEGVPAGEVAKRFAENLICDRLPFDDDKIPSVKPRKVDPWLRDLVIAAALLAKAYLHIKADGYHPLRRPDRTDYATLAAGSPRRGDIEEDYLDPCRELLESLNKTMLGSLRKQAADLGFANAVGTVFQQIAKRLKKHPDDPIKIRSSHVQALAELAWHALGRVADVKVYPGWSDLLLALSVDPELKPSIDPNIPGSRVGAPLIGNLMEAEQLIAKQFRHITEEAWKARRKESDPFYDAVARVLNEQREYRELRREKPLASKLRRATTIPVPTAFVTSFDLELELALLRAGSRFTIALPVHLINNRHSLAHVCWFLLDIPARDTRGNEPLSELLPVGGSKVGNPSRFMWRLAAKSQMQSELSAEEGPVIVRLAGCPLIQLPPLLNGEKQKKYMTDEEKNLIALKQNLIENFESILKTEVEGYDKGADDKKRKKILERVKSTLTLSHAVVISEHDAMLQSAVDLISTGNSASTNDDRTFNKGLRYGLPPEFAASTDSYSRFWMMLGVQVGDRAVRHRVSNLVAALPFTDLDRSVFNYEPYPGKRVQQPLGFAVNRYLTDLEQDLLYWNGFDVVNEDVGEFTRDLDHYAAHLEDANKRQRDRKEKKEESDEDSEEFKEFSRDSRCTLPRAS